MSTITRLWIAFTLAALGICIAHEVNASPICEAAIAIEYGNTSETRPKWAISSCARVSKLARAHGVRISLAVAVASHESDFNRWKVSSSGAIGVMQVKPHYHCPPFLGVRVCKSHRETAEVGIRYLAQQLERHSDREALRCYHDGIRACRTPGESRYASAVLAVERAILGRTK